MRDKLYEFGNKALCFVFGHVPKQRFWGNKHGHGTRVYCERCEERLG